MLARLTRAQSGDPGSVDRLVPIVDIGVELARKIQRRVTQQAILGDYEREDSFTRYGGKASYPVSQSYAQAAGVQPKLTRYWETREDASELKTAQKAVQPFKSAAAFHAAANTRPGTFNVTGGMWKGLQARASGRSAVVLDFQGSSPGAGDQETRTVWGWRNYTGKPEVVKITLRTARAKNIRNSEKATMVAKMARVQVLRPRNAEIAAITEVVTVAAAAWTSGALQLGADRIALPRFGGDTELRSRLAALI